MIEYRIWLGAGMVFVIVATIYAYQKMFGLLLVMWAIFSICAPAVCRDPKGTLLGLFGSAMTSLGVYLICTIEPFRTDVDLFDLNNPAESEALFFLSTLLCWLGLALTIGGIISADRRGDAS